MKFFFPDSQDQVDPSFDFVSEMRSPDRVRQRDDHYCHEALGGPAYSGMLVSKAIVDGRAQGTARYTIAQRNRFYREGVRRFLRLDEANGKRIDVMGDCGAFSYVREAHPPYTVDDVIDFYEAGFDFGVSVDHVILGYDDRLDLFEEDGVPEEWRARQHLTLQLAEVFLNRCAARAVKFLPVGVAQGWSPVSYARAVMRLQAFGYDRIGLGGMVPLKTPQILKCLRAVESVRYSSTQLHLFGISRCEHVLDFARYGVTSFDSTSPFVQAFKDMTDNYYTPERTYIALRVPQVDSNPKLKGRILAGQIEQATAIKLESACLNTLRAFDRGDAPMQRALEALMDYERFLDDGKESHRAAYEEVLSATPWRDCPCRICRTVGVDVVIFRGSERNKRRGFHNVFVFNNRLSNELTGEVEK